MDMRWRDTPKRVESNSNKAMLRAAESSHIAVKTRGADGKGIGVAFETHGIGDLVDGPGDFFETLIGHGGDDVFPGGKQRRLIEADDKAARLHADIDLPGFNFFLQFFGKNFERRHKLG
jgi:hypothetical protein